MTERESMHPQQNGRTPIERLTKAEIARAGANYFIEASGKFSASTPCIAAQLALFCRDYGLPPRIMGTLLVVDDVQVERIEEAANNAHEKHGKPPVKELADPKVFIRENYALAERMKVLPDDELKGIIARYEPGDSEIALRGDVEAMLSEKRRERRSRSLPPHK